MSIPEVEIERLYDQLGPVLLAYARSVAPDHAEAEDTVQHVFLKLMAPDAVLPDEPRPYLFRAVRNVCLNRRRGAARESARGATRPMFTAPDGLHALAADLETALGDLPGEQREVVVLRIWGDLTLEEAARVTGVPLNTAASRYRYALAKLRQRFGAHLRS